MDPSLASYSLINGTTQKIYDCGLDIFIAVESTFHFLFSKVDCGLLYCYFGLYALDYISFVKLSVNILDNKKNYTFCTFKSTCFGYFYLPSNRKCCCPFSSLKKLFLYTVL